MELNMKYIHKLSVRITVAALVGFLLAGAFTHITYTCTPIEGAAGCVSFDKAVMHPNDLLRNKQGSLVHFSETFVITSLVVFVILELLIREKKRRLKGEKA
jgi:hypothetical protein